MRRATEPASWRPFVATPVVLPRVRISVSPGQLPFDDVKVQVSQRDQLLPELRDRRDGDEFSFKWLLKRR